jgi:hypothetical protein
MSLIRDMARERLSSTAKNGIAAHTMIDILR